MPVQDLDRAELERYRTSAVAPSDLDAFWQRTLSLARESSSPARIERVDTGLTLVDTSDVTFSGFGGHPVRAWLHRPAGVRGPVPIVVRYQGYGGGRGLPHSVPLWPLAGYACLDVDTRGQGSGYTPGDTPDPVGSAPSHPGFLTRGLDDPEQYYYRRVFTDAVLAAELGAGLPDVNGLVVAGGSQGGGIAVAVAALHPGVGAVLSDVPFLSDLRRAAQLATLAPYTELTRYLAVHADRVQQVFATLAYFDISVLGTRASAPALFSVALMDETCPPSTVYAAVHAYGGPVELRVWEFNDHEGGHAFQEREQLAFLRRTLETGAAG